MKFPIAFCLAITLSASVIAKEPTPKPMQAALSNFVTEALYCTAYFGFAQEAVRRRSKVDAPRAQKLVERLGQMANRALNLAVTTGRRVELTQDGLAAQQTAVFDDVKKMTKNSMANLPVLIEKYDKPCKALTKTPEVRVQELFRNEFK